MKQRTGILRVFVIVLMLVFIGALVMTLIKGDFKQTSKTVAIDSPKISHQDITSNAFNDGLGRPSSVTYGTLDEFGEGIESIAEFWHDINQDGTSDKITRTHVATGNDHDYDEYKIELNINGILVDITPSGMRTTHGADCALRLIKFIFKPALEIQVISRPFQDTWDTPSMATKSMYSINQNQIINVSTKNLSTVCDVTTLF